MIDVESLFTKGEYVESTGQVGVDDTVGNFSVHLNQLLSTTACIDRMIRLCVRMVDERLPEGYVTVGTRYDIDHHGTAMLGTTLRSSLTLTDIVGHHLHFSLEISDDEGPVFQGTCERVVVNRYSLMDKATDRELRLRRGRS